ncbi:unnamed protein product [Clonostachys byssicola]|uniref:Metal ion transporter C27B12.12c n=1 Tax=Clonostachys byssicola TaxID=160290 RepID=A0A9N9UCI0_9HYPO|nr:unnamed protein product [Clonostachys byssicola]
MEHNLAASAPDSPQCLPGHTNPDGDLDYPLGLLNRPSIHIEDFEEVATINGDESNANVDSTNVRSHRGSGRSAEEERPASPPSSIKAFASARRRPRRELGAEFDLDPEESVTRAASVSNRSHSSKPLTGEYRPGSNLNRSYNEEQKGEVVDPTEAGISGENNNNDHSESSKEDLYIDFEFLEQFIQTERASHQNAPMQNDNTIPGLADDVVVVSPVDPDSDKLHKIQKGGRALDLNRFSFFSTVWESTVHASELANLVQDGESLKSLFEHPRNEHCVWWLNCNNPTKEEVQGLCQAFGIHPLTVEDIITREAREKIELVSSYYFASFQSFHTVKSGENLEYEGFNMYVIVFREGVLSFSFMPNPHATSVRRKITTLKEYISLSSDWICYALIDNIVDDFGPVIRQLEREVDSIDDSVFLMRDRDSSEFLRRIGLARKNCMALIRLIGGKADVLRSFTKRCNEDYPNAPHTDIGIYLSDIQDHVVTMTTNIIHFEQILARAHSNYLATVSVMSISQGNNTNKMLNKITLLASILVPLNLVGAVFGMNIPVPLGTVDRDNLGPFFGVIGFMALFTSFMLGLGRYHGLI